MSSYRNPILRLGATLYKLKGIEKTAFKFRILEIRERVPNDSRFPLRMQKWADELWRKKLRCPVAPTSRSQRPGFLVVDSDGPPAGSVIEILDVPDKMYHIEVTEKTLDIDLTKANVSERELVCRMLERPFTDKFRSMTDKYWKDQWTQFFRLTPENENIARDQVSAFRGLKFRVVFLHGIEPYLATDVRTRYYGRKCLSDHNEEERRNYLFDHLDLSRRAEKRAYFLRDNGSVKIPCKYTGETEKTVGEFYIDELKSTVYAYYRQRYPNLNVRRNDEAVFVQDRKSETSFAVPSSRLYPIYLNDFEGVRKCTIRSQMTPKERVECLADFLADVRTVSFADCKISLNQAPFEAQRSVFSPPALEFAGSKLLDPFDGRKPPDASSRDLDSIVSRYGSRKITKLYQTGPEHKEALPGTILLYPSKLSRDAREKFLGSITQEVKSITGKQLHIIKQLQYATGSQERMGTSLLREAAEVKINYSNHLILAILWDEFALQVHGELKEALRPLFSQCINLSNVYRMLNDVDTNRLRSLKRNIAIAILTEVGMKPWVLAHPLHHDLYVGIDVLHGRVGYHFLYGKGGRMMRREFGHSLGRYRMQEAIKAPHLESILESVITDIYEKGHKINSIVVHRDGRWWDSESEGLRHTIKGLKSRGALHDDVFYSAVEIRKSHAPVRLFTIENDGQRVRYINPLPGTYLLLDQFRSLLSTSGRPGAWDSSYGRTAGTLLLEVVDYSSEPNIEHITEDTYRLTHLNWAAPDIALSLPVTIRWTDEALRETFIPWSESRDIDADEKVDDDQYKDHDLPSNIPGDLIV